MTAPARPEYRHRDIDPTQPISLPLVGYTDRLDAAPGDTIRFMVSSDHPRYRSQLVRLIHGDTNPGGPGFKQVVVPSAIDGERDGRASRHPQRLLRRRSRSTTRSDGRLHVHRVHQADAARARASRCSSSRGDPFNAGGLAVGLDEDGALELVVGGRGEGDTADAPHRFSTGRPDAPLGVVLRRRRDRAGRRELWQQARPAAGRTMPSNATRTSRSTSCPSPHEGPLRACGGPRRRRAARTIHFDGRIDRPRAIGRALSGAEVLRLESAPDDLDAVRGGPHRRLGLLGRHRHRPRHRPLAGRPPRPRRQHADARRHGLQPRRAARRTSAWRPGEYGAIHFHRDDLEDAGWPVAFELTIPDDLPSGIYAAWLTAGDDEDYLPFTVTPPRGTARSEDRRPHVDRDLRRLRELHGRRRRRPGAIRLGADPIGSPLADNTIFREVYGYIEQNALFGLYDTHVDGHGVAYGSCAAADPQHAAEVPLPDDELPGALPGRPVPRRLARPQGHRRRLPDRPRPPRRGGGSAAAVQRRAVVVAPRVLDERRCSTARDVPRRRRPVHVHRRQLAVRRHVDRSAEAASRRGAPLGRAVAVRACRPAIATIRRPASRAGSGRTAAARRTRIVGMGRPARASTGARRISRTEASYDRRVSWIFDGVDGDLIGDSPNLQVKWGAAGYEFDRVDYELGSPGTTVILGSSVRFNESHKTMIDEELYFIPGRDGAHPTDPQVPGKRASVRALGHGVPRVSERRRGVLGGRDLLARRAVRLRLREHGLAGDGERPAPVRRPRLEAMMRLRVRSPAAVQP